MNKNREKTYSVTLICHWLATIEHANLCSFQLSLWDGNGSFRPRVVSALSRFGPGRFGLGHFGLGRFGPGSFRPSLVVRFGLFFLNYQACYRRSTKYIFG